MWKQIKNIIAVLLVVTFIASLCLNVHFYTSRQERIATGDTTRVTIFDTIPYPMPLPKDSVVIRYITKKLPINTGNGQIEPGNIPDSAKVTIPITQKIYETDLYKAYISGYRPSLDSLLIFQQTQIIHIKDNPKSKRWGIGIQAGCGFGKNGFGSYFGIDISYNLFQF